MTFECDTTWVCLLHKVWVSYPDAMRFILGVSQRQLLKQSWKHSKSCCLKLNLVLTSIPAVVFRMKRTLQFIQLDPLWRKFQVNHISWDLCCVLNLKLHFSSPIMSQHCQPERLASEGQCTQNIHNSALWTGYSWSWLIFGPQARHQETLTWICPKLEGARSPHSAVIFQCFCVGWTSIGPGAENPPFTYIKQTITG